MNYKLLPKIESNKEMLRLIKKEIESGSVKSDQLNKSTSREGGLKNSHSS